MKQTYDPKGFKDIFESDLGKSIFDYLNTQEAKDRMILTSQFGHPAAEGIGDKLLAKFGDRVKEDRVKQATGHMIRHIMEELGFRLVEQNVDCRYKKEVFVVASRYESSY